MILSPEIQKIRDKVISQGWPKMIRGISIEGIHGFNKKQIVFQFPVCAIVGENGTGKSTILKLLACAYKNSNVQNNFYPSDFFPDTAWDSLAGVRIAYQIVQGPRVADYRIAKKTQRWKGITERLSNNVFYFDINRIQSIESVVGYAKLAKRKIKEVASRPLSSESIDNISEIMGRKYLGGRYAKTSIDTSKEIGILKFSHGEISKFHQGTGESIVFDLISSLENIPQYSLIVIDEIESSLHPKAQRRLIRNLLALARVKTLQIVFSTHSPYILEELPPEARILLTRVSGGSEVIYAPTVKFCLSQIDDKLHADLDILVEDDEAGNIVSQIIRTHQPDLLSRVRILPVGPANIIEMIEDLYKKNKLPFKILGILDADQKANMTRLPGNSSPEKQIIEDITKNNLFPGISQLIGLREVEVAKEVKDVQTIQNSNEWITKLAKRFNISCDTLFNYLVFIWVKNCLPEVEAKKVINAIVDRLNDSDKNQ